ncbi:MAG: radical SAM protein [Chloroflexota bacterium]|nr:radical SAM protein [Chloroflexota bacterium]
MTWEQTAESLRILERERGTIIKDWGGKLPIVLAYPNTYYVGMSSLALQILYRRFNEPSNTVCERVFWDKGGAEAGRSLLSLETSQPVDEFAVWAFTISYEMDYFNVVGMLRQAGVPALAVDRDERWPLLIAGGPGITMNPEPMAPFFDAIVVGEGEEVVDTLVDTIRDVGDEDRSDLIAALDRIEGVYVPALVPQYSATPGSRQIKRLWVRRLENYSTVSSLYTPDTEFGGLHLMEIARGCGRGCRFCLAGYVYRPPREQPLEQLLEWARQGLEHRERIGLVSAAVSDHSQIDELAVRLRELGAKLSVSSMRVDPISVPLVTALRESGTRTLTIAPEAGSTRLRNVINKTQTEQQILDAVDLAQSLGFPQLKLYFMIGHPGETDEDIEALVDLTMEARGRFKRRLVINATPFVPKAHTPFQWEPMTKVDTLKRRQRVIQRSLARQGVDVRSESAQWAAVQGVLARGDRRLAPVLLSMDKLSIGNFKRALAENGLSMEDYLGPRQAGTAQPWDIVESGVSTNYLLFEHRHAQRFETGLSCPPDSSGCLTCGCCDTDWAYRAANGVPFRSKGPWRAQDWRPASGPTSLPDG